MSIAQETIDALDEAGRLMAPILQSEAIEGPFGPEVPSISISASGAFLCHGFLGRDATGRHISAVGRGETASAAFFDFLAKRSPKLAELEAAKREQEEFAAWKAQREQEAA